MAIYKRGDTYWYKFKFKGKLYRASTRVSNANAARDIESAKRTALAKGEVGIEERGPVPTLKEFAPRFEKAIETLCASKPRTVEFYKEKLKRLLERGESLHACPLDRIDEAAIARYKEARSRQISRHKRPVSAASVNR